MWTLIFCCDILNSMNIFNFTKANVEYFISLLSNKVKEAKAKRLDALEFLL